MSYKTYSLLTEDLDFSRRARACIMEQSNIFINDTRPDLQALAMDLMKFAPTQTQSMIQGICAGPGFADEVDNGDGTITSDNVTDADILSQTQAIFPTIASLFYDDTGASIPAR